MIKRKIQTKKIICANKKCQAKVTVQGSFTIEAAIIVPMLVFLFAITINCGLEMYTECRDMAVKIQEEEELDIVTLFYRYQKIGDMVEDGD